MRYFFLIFVFFFLTHIESVYSQKFEIANIPDWVTPVNPLIESKVTQYEISSGVYTSLFDSQINLGIGADFSHYIASVLTNGGVSNASEIYISYDTSYQSLSFHYLYIWRKGKKIDRTSELSFEILKNEENLQSGIYTGLITAYDILDDIRKDDKIEYAYTIFGDNPIFSDNIKENMYSLSYYI